jgi:hypothetical protein
MKTKRVHELVLLRVLTTPPFRFEIQQLLYDCKPSKYNLFCTSLIFFLRSLLHVSCTEVVHSISKKKYSCDICSRSYQHNSSLMRHMKEHNDSFTWRWSVCNLLFESDGNYTDHYEKCHINRYLCTSCGRGLKTKTALNMHTIQNHLTSSF